MKRVLFLLFVSLGSFLFAESLTLMNDSNYRLTAVIYNAAGDKETSVQINPGQTYMWYSDQSPFKKQYDQPYTPYTVRWLCAGSRPYNYNQPAKKDEKKPNEYATEFGSWENVPPGAMVRALSCPSGNKTCVLQKRQPKGQKQETKQVPPKRSFQTDGFNNFSNDGGKSWSNDGGSFEDEDEGEGHMEEIHP